MFLRATAKINLSLDVLRRRPDGYHEVKMVMQMVGMFDRLHLYARKSAGSGGQIRMTANLPYIPTDERNLVVKAARLLMEEKGVTDDLEVHLGKFIPVAAGLAGGSSDAAMTLLGVNRLFRLGFSEAELMERGARIGADVPYCMMKGTALSEGIGEVLTPLPDFPDAGIVLAKPPVSVSTKEVYEALDAHAVLEEDRPDTEALIAGLRHGSLEEICAPACMKNVLETVTAPRYPLIGELEGFLKEAGAFNAVMSGSGPTVFGIFQSLEEAESACRALRSRWPQVRSFATIPVRRE